MTNLDGGKFDKFLVFKINDIQKYSNNPDKSKLAELSEKICDGRHSEGKSWSNQYLVINIDDPYTDEVIEILKRNGHWG